MGSSSRHHLDYGLWSGRWTRSAFAPNDAIDNDKDSKNLQNANSHRIVFRVVWCSRLRLVKRQGRYTAAMRAVATISVTICLLINSVHRRVLSMTLTLVSAAADLQLPVRHAAATPPQYRRSRHGHVVPARHRKQRDGGTT